MNWQDVAAGLLESLAGLFVVLAPFIGLWAYYLITGSPIQF